MRKTILGLAALLLIVSTRMLAAQTEIEKHFYRLDIALDGKASCFWEGSDCMVG